MTEPQEKNWWERNWKWFVPVGCLSALILFVGFGALIAYFVFSFAKSSEVYKAAVAKAKTNAAVMEALGSPLEEGFFVVGKINISGSSGQADLAIPISGPKGDGTLFVVATKSAGQWNVSTLVAAISKTGERINLMDEVSNFLKSFTGIWEYRQRNSSSPTGYDKEGEILDLIQIGDSIQGHYFGLERAEDHGLFYTLVEIEDVEVSDGGKITFTVPARSLYRERPRGFEDLERLKATHSGFTKVDLKFQGQLKNGELILRCFSQPGECPEDMMVFRKGAWEHQ
ncbi:cytochrome c oxidase assembly factor Coa1 family protein [Thermodesulfobacteriota bacterium]